VKTESDGYAANEQIQKQDLGLLLNTYPTLTEKHKLDFKNVFRAVGLFVDTRAFDIRFHSRLGEYPTLPGCGSAPKSGIAHFLDGPTRSS
jgi:hypothetical protein